jgi:thioredoxin 1
MINITCSMDEDLERIRAKKLEEMKQRIASPSSEDTSILVLNQENFVESVKNNRNLVVDFWAPWCGPCRMVAPVIEALASEYAGKIRFGKCNTDENQQIAYQFGISAIPTLFFYQDEKLVHQIAGALPKPQLEMQLRSIFKII